MDEILRNNLMLVCGAERLVPVKNWEGKYQKKT